MTGPSPVDRGKPGSKLHVLSDATGLPMATGISAGNTADGDAMIPLVNAIPPVRSQRGPRRRKPAKLHGDKAYNSRERRRWLRDRGNPASAGTQGYRVQGAPRPPPVGHRTLHGLVHRLPPPDA